MRTVLRWWLPALVLLAAGGALLLTADDGVQRSGAVAGSTPVRVLAPEASARRAPAIVLAHGFAGSAAMVDPLGSALVRAGHLVVAPDLPGHGRNPAPLVEGALDPAVTDAVELAARVTGQPVAVIGHSMGAGAVTAWASDNPAPATVAISLPSAEELPADPARPANLLLLWGSAEQQRFVDAALAALRLAYPEGVAGPTYGDPAGGTARRAAEIPGAEHVAVIYRAQTAREVAAWLGVPVEGDRPEQADGDAPGSATGDARLAGVALVLAGGVVLVRPLLGRAAPPSPTGAAPPDRPGTAGVRVRPVLGWLLLAAVGAGLGARVLQGIGAAVPVAVCGYLAAWFGSGALVLLLAARRREVPSGTGRGALAGLVAGVVLAVALAQPARVSWAGFALVGPRPWVLIGLLLVLAAWFWAEARLLAGLTGWRRAGTLLASRALVVVGLLGAVLVLGAPGFLVLTVPLVIPLLAVLGVVAFWARDPLAAGPAQAVPLALTMATTFPIVG